MKRNVGCRFLAAILLTVGLWGRDTVCSAPLVQNADFSKLVAGSGNVPEVWQIPKGKGWEYTNEDGMSGNDSLRYLARTEQPATFRMTAVTQKVTCQANTEYVLSAALKSDGLLQPVVRVVDGADTKTILVQLAATQEKGPWKRYTSKFRSGASTSLVVELWGDAHHARGESGPAGTTSFDDIRILSAAETAPGGDAAPVPQYDNVAKGKSYTLNNPPNYALCTDAEDTKQLTDGVYSVGYFWAQKTTVGWQGKRPLVITVDLGKVEPIRGFSYNTAAGIAGVAWPASVCVLVSDDGKGYYIQEDIVAQSNARDTPPPEGYAIHRYWADGLRTHGRFVQFLIDPGGPYCFTDEVEVFRGDDAWVSLPIPGEATTGADDYFKLFSVTNAIKGHLSADIRETREAAKAAGLREKETAALQKELNAIEAEIPNMAPVDPVNYSAVLPLNELHARTYATAGRIRKLQGRPALEVWASNPYDYLTPTQTPPTGAARQIAVAMMRGEWRYAVVNLTSSTDKAQTVNLRAEGLPGGTNPDWVTVCEVQWTDTKEQKPIGVALTAAERGKDGYLITVPAGMTRQVWFTFHPTDMTPPRTYPARVVITPPGGKPLTVPLSLRIYPLTFPKQPTLHVGGWDYTDTPKMYGVTKENREALVAHLQERFVDSPWGTSSALSWGNPSDYDADGNLKKEISTAYFDQWVDRWPNARRYCVFVSVNDSILGAPMGTPKFNNIVKSWINFWVEHAATKGIKPEQLVLLTFDEPSANQYDQIIINWVKAIRAAQPKVVLWEDPTYLKPWEAMPEMMSSVDVLCPNRPQMLQEGKDFENFYRKQKADGRRLDFYSCSGPMHLLDPYSYVRLQAWTCWDMGAESTNFWAFGDSGGGNPWQPYTTQGTNYAPMFIAPDSVTPGKHMEAVRESVEDYEYFVMLRDAVAKAKPNNPALPKAKELLASGAQRALQAENASKLSWLDPKDRSIADGVRTEILEALSWTLSNQ